MKNIIITIALTICCVFAMNATATAADILVESSASKVLERIDKNGNPYKMIIFTLTKELSGIKYDTTAPLMVFGEKLPQVSSLSDGDSFRAIVNHRTLSDGRDSYTLIQMVK